MPGSSFLSSSSPTSLNKLFLLPLLLLAVLLSGGSWAYPYGAPSSRCSSMVPNHSPLTARTTADYTVTASSSTYSPGQSITVTIAAVGGDVKFRGFMLQARPADNTGSYVTVGTFTSGSDSNVICSQGGITHSSGSDKSSITVTWNPPSEPQGDVKFRATVVRVKAVYYPEVYSDVVSESAPATSPPTTPMTSPSTTPMTSPSTASMTSPPTTTMTSPPTTPMTSPSTASMTSPSTASMTSPSTASMTAAVNTGSSVSGMVSSSTSSQDESNTGPSGGVGPVNHCGTISFLLLLMSLMMLRFVRF